MIGKWQWGARWIYNPCLGTMLAWGVGEKKKLIRRVEEESTKSRRDRLISIKERRWMEHQQGYYWESKFWGLGILSFRLEWLKVGKGVWD